MKLADLHTHTELCKHASGKPLEYLQAAAKAGLAAMGVSDHCPWPEGFDSKWRMAIDEFPAYAQIVQELKAEAPSTGVEVLYGLELDYVPGRMEEVWRGIAQQPFDYLIGSVHYVACFPMDDPSMKGEWEKHGGPDAIWSSYAGHLLEFVQDGGFDFIGHCDLPKKFAFYPSSLTPFRRKMREVFEAAAANKIAIELNTAGLRKAAKEIYPSLELLKDAHDAGVEICFGSDAHCPAEVAMGFAEALELAKTAGYERFCSFKQRQRSLYALE